MNKVKQKLAAREVVSAAPARMSARWEDLEIKKNPKVRDLWAHTDVDAPAEYSVEVPSHGVVMLKVQ